MKKKKLIATVLSASMLVGLLAGCGSSTDPAESPTGGGETTPAQGETTPAQNDVDYANFVIFKCLPEVHVLVLPPLIRVKDQAIYRGNFVKAPANILWICSILAL